MSDALFLADKLGIQKIKGRFSRNGEGYCAFGVAIHLIYGWNGIDLDDHTRYPTMFDIEKDKEIKEFIIQSDRKFIAKYSRRSIAVMNDNTDLGFKQMAEVKMALDLMP